ncbi:bifunctional PIG-L family deacetylase/class I SAM-dependent methyltransferase [Phycicoccus sp. Root101]|uniref:bifunctional PIG-L family deacetylase/class I SAM-dependent methyltransferase n=1 Tax=Phycicoccus sp. Root101 TaxID=1736421 RepID=UPI00070376E4|nr:bifunctional PIG-L family deacetylase/class I SAM-dependent methyltransferase [Phycicoccus sp. Root101]KQU68571.1 hypothetical protein ASC58_07580 [Phycicoccus sp. Root101]
MTASPQDTRPADGFDPNAPGTPEEHWTAAMQEAAAPVTAVELLPAGVDVVVLSAHPDDESLAAAGLMAAASALGRPTTVVVATSGEGSHPASPTHTAERLAGIREREVAVAVAAVAPGATLVLLRLPDGELGQHRTGLTEALTDLVGADTVVVAPSRHDGHPDHEAAGEVAARVAAAAGATLVEYPIWLWHWGTRDDLAGRDLVRLALDPAARTGREVAQRAHVSQVAPLSDQPGDEVLLPAHVLARFARPHEVFVRTLPDRGVAAPVNESLPMQRTRTEPTRTQPTQTRTAPGGPAGAQDAVFDAMFDESDDPWGFESRWYERRKRAVTLAVLPRADLGRVLEVGCSTGVLTAELAARAATVLATDLSAEAVQRARQRLDGDPTVTVAQLRAPQEWPPGTFDLVVLSEIGYFWDADELHRALGLVVASLAEDGLVLLCHWRHPVSGWPLDGDDVHAAAVALPGLEVVVSHVEEDFRVDVLAAGSWRTPATAEGLT